MVRATMQRSTTSFSSLRASTLRVEVVETYVVDLPIIRPHLLSVATMQAQTLMIVKIVCSDGVTGFGEGTTIGGLSYGAESPEGMKLAIDPIHRTDFGIRQSGPRTGDDERDPQSHQGRQLRKVRSRNGAPRRLGQAHPVCRCRSWSAGACGIVCRSHQPLGDGALRPMQAGQKYRRCFANPIADHRTIPQLKIERSGDELLRDHTSRSARQSRR